HSILEHFSYAESCFGNPAEMLSNTLFEQLCEINNVLRMSVLPIVDRFFLIWAISNYLVRTYTRATDSGWNGSIS
ncbi:hypothetical protein, partial [Haloarcula sp. CGMCC 1.2071]|uniref:hypothetical protein n=1 Tax=Haloarcula sp. CGMCC 1.2071 TaxID=3111454 RepID=UPI00300F59E4